MGQWFPGHIAKAEKELKEQLKLMDVVIEVRDGRIPISTSHPQASIFLSFLKIKNINFVKYPLRVDMNDVCALLIDRTIKSYSYSYAMKKAT